MQLAQAFFVLALGTLGAPSDADEATRRTLTAMKQQVVRAFIDKDKESLERIYADDYVATNARGSMRTKRDEIDRLGEDGDTLLSGRYERCRHPVPMETWP